MSSREKPAPVTSAIEQFEIRDNELVVGGVPISRLARRVGATPFFAYDRALIAGRVAHLRRNLPDRIQLSYAMKANPMPAVVQYLAGLVDGLDVASSLEMMVALDTTMPAGRISFAGPGKTQAELAQAAAAGVVVNLESEHELESLAAIAEASGDAPEVAVRVNPDFELKSSGMRMSGGPKQFGVDAERVPAMLARIGELGLGFAGFHIFCGSQNLREQALIEAQAKTVDLALDLARSAPGPVRHFNIGGGFGIPYFPGDSALDIGPVGAALDPHLDRIAAVHPGARVIVELGRYFVGEAGVYISRVIDRKVSRGRVFLITDGGLHHQLAASGNFGQVIRKNYPVAVATRMAGETEQGVDVVGCLCTPLDLLGDRMDLPHAEIGDLIAVFQSGAYGLTASPTAFLSHPAPREILV